MVTNLKTAFLRQQVKLITLYERRLVECLIGNIVLLTLAENGTIGMAAVGNNSASVEYLCSVQAR